MPIDTRKFPHLKLSNMKYYNDLNETDKEQLLKFPAYISLLASTAEAGIDKAEMTTAVKITHVKTFSGDPILREYYKDAEHVFEDTITNLNNELPHDIEERKSAILHELNKLEPLIQKLDPGYANILRRSMKSYKHYISKAHRNVLEYFIFPMPIEGVFD